MKIVASSTPSRKKRTKICKCVWHQVMASLVFPPLDYKSAPFLSASPFLSAPFLSAPFLSYSYYKCQRGPNTCKHFHHHICTEFTDRKFTDRLPE